MSLASYCEQDKGGRFSFCLLSYNTRGKKKDNLYFTESKIKLLLLLEIHRWKAGNSFQMKDI